MWCVLAAPSIPAAFGKSLAGQRRSSRFRSSSPPHILPLGRGTLLPPVLRLLFVFLFLASCQGVPRSPQLEAAAQIVRVIPWVGPSTEVGPPSFLLFLCRRTPHTHGTASAHGE